MLQILTRCFRDSEIVIGFTQALPGSRGQRIKCMDVQYTQHTIALISVHPHNYLYGFTNQAQPITDAGENLLVFNIL